MGEHLFTAVNPQEGGIDPKGIDQTIADIRQVNGLELHSFILLRSGKLIREEYFRDGEAQRLHALYSVSKSFTSAAIGIAQAQGLLSVQDKLYDFFPEHRALCDSDHKRAVTLRDLLTMGSGFENNEGAVFGLGHGDFLPEALKQPIIHRPGDVFDYYTLGTYLLSAAFSRVCPEGIHAYLRRKLFAPMQIEESVWNVDHNGIPMGGFGLYLKARDLARFGQLLLQKGQWEGQQLLPESYVQAATAKQIDNGNHPSGNVDWTAGYGYQLWRNDMGGYRADGMFGQYIIVLPEKQAVIAMTSQLNDMQIPLTAIRTHLLPAMD